MNHFDLTPEASSMATSPQADQTHSLTILALGAELALESQRREAESASGGCWSHSYAGLESAVCALLGLVTAAGEVMITLCTWLFLSPLI